MAKKFFYVCAGIMMLAGAYAIGANGVQAQNDPQAVLAMSTEGNYAFVVTSGGDLYRSTNYGDSWSFVTNAFTGAVASESQGLDGVKSNFR